MVSISVVIPVYNSAEHLRSCLEALAQSSVSCMECIVVNDGSTDESADVAKAAGANLLSTEGRSGPAHARNLGVRAAKGDIILFLDADVCVYPDTVERIRQAFEDDPHLDGLIGSYDDSPSSRDFISQYRNLMHCFVHQTSKNQAGTFWSGCGAIRRSVFLEHAGFDESYARPAIEDIELGYRLFLAGRKVILDKTVLVKHLKHWTFWGLVKTDVLDRGIPWTELILRDRHMPNDLNIELSQRVSVALSFVLMGVTTAAAVFWGWYFVTPLMAVLFFLLSQYWLESTSKLRSKSVVILMTVVIAIIIWQAYVHRMVGILPPLLLGYLLLFLRHRYAYDTDRSRRLTGMILGAYIVAAIIFIVSHLPNHMLVSAFFVVAALIVVLNNQFYLFLAAKQGRFFAVAAVPFHLLYHLYNGISFVIGLCRYSWRCLFHRKAKLATNRLTDERN